MARSSVLVRGSRHGRCESRICAFARATGTLALAFTVCALTIAQGASLNDASWSVLDSVVIGPHNYTRYQFPAIPATLALRYGTYAGAETFCAEQGSVLMTLDSLEQWQALFWQQKGGMAPLMPADRVLLPPWPSWPLMWLGLHTEFPRGKAPQPAWEDGIDRSALLESAYIDYLIDSDVDTTPGAKNDINSTSCDEVDGLCCASIIYDPNRLGPKEGALTILYARCGYNMLMQSAGVIVCQSPSQGASSPPSALLPPLPPVPKAQLPPPSQSNSKWQKFDCLVCVQMAIPLTHIGEVFSQEQCNRFAKLVVNKKLLLKHMSKSDVEKLTTKDLKFECAGEPEVHKLTRSMTVCAGGSSAVTKKWYNALKGKRVTVSSRREYAEKVLYPAFGNVVPGCGTGTSAWSTCLPAWQRFSYDVRHC